MAEIIPFRRPEPEEEYDPEIDLMTAIDVAIRDLGDILAACTCAATRRQAVECRDMLVDAYRRARS